MKENFIEYLLRAVLVLFFREEKQIRASLCPLRGMRWLMGSEGFTFV